MKKPKALHAKYRVTRRPVTLGTELFKAGDMFDTSAFSSDYTESCEFLCANGLLELVTDEPAPRKRGRPPKAEAEPADATDLADLV